MNTYEKDPGWKFLRLPREVLLAEQSRPYDSKKNVWVPDAEDGYAAAEIVSVKGDNIVITVKREEKTIKKELIQEMNPPKFEKTEDMSNLTFLNDASVLYNLRARYGAMLIYTYSGLFCVVINPYKRLPIYTDSVARMFMGKRRTEMPPHLFAVSDEAYRNMLQNRENQSMLITGESGAGKTENTKKVIAYFASVGASQQSADSAVTQSSGKRATLEDQIVQTNPVLEAFGNAKTVRNNNSSRFGKFIRIHFNKAGRVASCDIEHYLLEKSRVIRQAPGERCYHIFYQIFSGYIPDLKQKLKLNKSLSDYPFIAQAELTIDGVDDKEEFKLTDEAFDVLNFSSTEKLDCYRLMAGIMHMGNMKFKQRPREEQAEPDETEEAKYASEMFSVDVDAVLNALVKPRVRVGNEWVSKNQNLDQVTWSIGAMVKALFARVFEWLVKKCNMTLDQKGLSRDYFIGVLDIAGFEIFDFNSFEQLWINFVNEKLQQFFNHHMFVLEQEEYAREGIQWTFIDFGLDLQACIELIEKPMGIISMLDEECIVPKATDQTLAQKLIEQHLGKHPNFEKPKPPKGKQAEAHFAMRHYAGTVRYNVSSWLEKNKDPLNDTLVSVMKSAKSNALLLEVWSNYTTQEEAAVKTKEGGGGGKKKGKSGSFMTVSMLYRESLNTLMTMLNKTHPHFIRCIIPNEKKASGVIDAALVLNQLTCNGVLEGIRICRKGFPNRLNHNDFVVRYSILAAEAARSSTDAKTAAAAVLDALVERKDLKPEHYKVGHTKIFFKSGVLANIEELRDIRQTELITGLQAAARGYLALREAYRRRKRLDSYYVLQKNIKAWCVLRTWEWYKLYGAVRPYFKMNKHGEEMERLEGELKSLEESFAREAEQRKAAEAEHAKIAAQRDELSAKMELIQGGERALQSNVSELSATKAELERRLNEARDRVADQEQRVDETQRAVRRAEKDRDSLNDQLGQLDEALARVEEEKAKLDERARQIHEEMAAQDEQIAIANREKKKAEEENRRLAESVQAETERNGQTNRIKMKLERSIEDVEDTLERERRRRSDIEKARKKLEAELVAVQEQLDEAQKQRTDAEARLQRIDAEHADAGTRLDEAQAQLAKVQRQLRDSADRCAELEEELEAERHARAKIDKARAALQAQLDASTDGVDDASGKTASQIELSKKKDLELARLRQELQAVNQRTETELAAARKRVADETAALSERVDQLQAAKAKVDKERDGLRHQTDDVATQIADEAKAAAERERYARAAEAQLAELAAKHEAQHKLAQELFAARSQLQMENVEAEDRLSDLQQRLTQTTKHKAQALAQLEDARQFLDEERQERQHLAGVAKQYEHELEQLREAIDDEARQKEDILKQVSRTKSEAQQWKAKFESEGLVGVDEMEEERRRRVTRRTEIQDALAEIVAKIANCEKSNAKLILDAEEARAEAERNRVLIADLERRHEAAAKAADDYHRQCDALAAEAERASGEARRSAAEVHSLNAATNTLSEQADELRRSNKTLGAELRDANEQLAASARNAREVSKKVRMLELEKEELQHALDGAESALEVEESKMLRIQSEVAQIRADIDRRIAEKEEDFENTVKNHQRAIDSIRASLAGEVKGRAALAQQKQKLESDLNDLELSLDMANRSNAETQKQLKKHQLHIQELQQQLEEEQRKREECRELFLNAERQLSLLLAERQELEIQREQLDAHKRRTEEELAEHTANRQLLQGENLQLTAARRAVENDTHIMKNELENTLTELRQVEEHFKKVNADVQRLMDELRQEQQHHDYVERVRKGYETQVKDLQVRYEQAETQMQRVGQRAVDKLAQCIRTREQELDIEQKHHKEVLKQLNKCEREVRERSFELEEHRKSTAKMQELNEKLQEKIKTHKKQLEEAEEVAAINQQKFRKIQTALGATEERADAAENSLSRMKSKVRGSATTANMSSLLNGAARGNRGGGIMHSATSAAIGGGASGVVPRTFSAVGVNNGFSATALNSGAGNGLLHSGSQFHLSTSSSFAAGVGGLMQSPSSRAFFATNYSTR